jgi:hypothetical protein
MDARKNESSSYCTQNEIFEYCSIRIRKRKLQPSRQIVVIFRISGKVNFSRHEQLSTCICKQLGSCNHFLVIVDLLRGAFGTFACAFSVGYIIGAGYMHAYCTTLFDRLEFQ